VYLSLSTFVLVKALSFTENMKQRIVLGLLLLVSIFWHSHTLIPMSLAMVILFVNTWYLQRVLIYKSFNQQSNKAFV